MKRLALIVMGLIVVAAMASVAAAAETGTWTGWIADENCAKNYEKAAKADHASCAKSCISRGAGWALAMKDGHVMLEIDKELAEKHLGHEVVVKGELNKETNTVKVTAVEMPKSE